MKKKLLFSIIVVFIGFVAKGQSKWSQKINFSSTAKIIGKVGKTADKVGKNTPGLVGATARLIGATAKAVSANAEKSSEKDKKK